HEQLGDLLMDLDRPAEALAEYLASLESFPNRFNSHYGAALAAQKAGRTDVMRDHSRRVIEMAGQGDGRREEIATMKKLGSSCRRPLPRRAAGMDVRRSSGRAIAYRGPPVWKVIHG